MAVDRKFLSEVQNAGWVITEVSDDAVLGACPNAGCGLKVTLRPGKSVPPASCQPAMGKVIKIRNFDDARLPLRERREDLCLSIKETEDICGIAVDYLAKFEKDNPSKIPNAQTFIEWAQGLGFVVCLIEDKLPPLAMETIAITRHRRAARVRMARHMRSRRAGA